MFERVKAPNSKQPNQPRLFPRGSLAIQAAADISPNKVDINAIITAAEARGQHDIWAETSPGSLLLLPTGQSTAAIADLMDVTYNSETGLMSLHVELVDNPDTISEFQPHGKQSLASDEAHYHFSTAPGVKVDAAALLKSLQEANFDINGEASSPAHLHCNAAMLRLLFQQQSTISKFQRTQSGKGQHVWNYVWNYILRVSLSHKPLRVSSV